MPDKEGKVDAILHRKGFKLLNSTLSSTIKTECFSYKGQWTQSGQVCSDAFKIMLDFSFTVIISA